MSGPSSRWPATWPLFIGFLTIAVLVGGLGGWSVMTTISGAIIVSGQFEVAQKRQVVQHPDGGVVSKIFVEEGAKVEAGDLLLQLEGRELKSELQTVESRIIELSARRARLEAESVGAESVVFPDALIAAAKEDAIAAAVMAGQASLFAKHAEALSNAREQRQAQIVQIKYKIEGLAAQELAISSQIHLVIEDLTAQRDLLTAGLTQAARVSAIERDLAELRGRLGALKAEQAEAGGLIAEIRIEISALDGRYSMEAETELRDVVAEENVNRERADALRTQIDHLDVRAPVAGIVLGLQVSTLQSVIRPAEILMYIVPQDRPLTVAARVPVMQVDEVYEGQNVRIVFTSLPSRTTPHLDGTLTSISADAFADERSGLTYYLAEVTVELGEKRDLDGIRILPGMPVSVYIQTEDRTPLSYLLKPFTDYFQSAFRET